MIACLRDHRVMLPQVTLCAVTSVNVQATVRALEVCLGQIAFAECKIFTDASIDSISPEIQIVPIDRLESSAAYSDFLLSRLVDYVETSHCLVVQWDGHVLDAKRWVPQFLDYDYIGASWPQFQDGYDVGNGGFSLRSRRLMEMCQAAEFNSEHPEDITIGRVNRGWLEERGMRFAPRELADAFSAERTGDLNTAFGYHGAFNMPRAIGPETFWEIYQGLDEVSPIRHDFVGIIKSMWPMRRAVGRIAQMTIDILLHRNLKKQ